MRLQAVDASWPFNFGNKRAIRMVDRTVIFKIGAIGPAPVPFCRIARRLSLNLSRRPIS
jgi:hypothetical protein